MASQRKKEVHSRHVSRSCSQAPTRTETPSVLTATQLGTVLNPMPETGDTSGLMAGLSDTTSVLGKNGLKITGQDEAQEGYLWVLREKITSYQPANTTETGTLELEHTVHADDYDLNLSKLYQTRHNF